MNAQSRPDGLQQVALRTARDNLRLLTRLRWLAICGQVTALTVTRHVLHVDLPVYEMVPVIGFLVFLNLFSSWRIRTNKPLSNITVVAELLMDVFCLTILLYLSGGASNPFVSLFILQVVLGVVLLPARHAALILAAAIAAHYWLLGNGLPLPLPAQHGHGSGGYFDLHLQGMFVSFTLSACLLAWFVTRIIANLRGRDEQVAEMRRQLLEEDHLVRLGLLASGAAHELGTPLTTLAVTLDDWRELGAPAGDAGRRQLERMLHEVARCRSIVSNMLLSSGQERMDEAEARPASAFIEDVLAGWRVAGLPPQVNLLIESAGRIIADPMLEQALRNLLENTREAGATQVLLSVGETENNRLRIRIRDDGPGFPEDVLEMPGQPFHSHRPGTGRGLGLFLTFNAMRRLGGEVRLANPAGGGAEVTLLLPGLDPETPA